MKESQANVLRVVAGVVIPGLPYGYLLQVLGMFHSALCLETRRAKRLIFVHILRLPIDNITTLAIMDDNNDLPNGTILPMVFGPLVNDKLTAGIEAAIRKWCIGEMVAGDRLLGGNCD